MKLMLRSTIILCFLLIFCFGVSAADAPHIVYDYSNNRVSISGESSDENVQLQILQYGKSISDLAGTATDLGSILYIRQADLSENGIYSFEARYSDSNAMNFTSGEYNAYLRSGNEITEFKLELYTDTDYGQAADLLNASADSGNYAEFKSVLEANSRLFGISADIYKNLNSSDALEPCMKYIKSNHLKKSESKNNGYILNRFIIMQAVKSSMGFDPNAYVGDCFDEADKLYSDYKKYVSDDDAKKNFAEMIKVELPESCGYDDFEASFKKALILTTVRYPSGYGDVKYILSSYGDTIGINQSASDSVYRKLIGDYADSDALVKAYNDAVKPQGGSSTGGSSVGSGSKSGSGNVSFEPPVNNEDNKSIDVYFDDIDGVGWATEAITALADKGILNGKSKGIFKPNDNITREEFAKILVHAMGLEKSGYTKNNFRDVSSDAWYCGYVNIAFEQGILKGRLDGIFGTGDMITRQDIAVMVCNALKTKGVTLPESELFFDDKGEISDYAIQSVAALYKMNVVNGVSETVFDPCGKATRAQAAKIVYGVLDMLK